MRRKLGFVALAITLVAVALAYKQVSRLWAAEGRRARILITRRIDEKKLVRLWGNTRPEAKKREYDRGLVANDFLMENMLLQLKRPPELQQQFDAYVDSLSDKSSPNFHQWLSAAQQGEQYGLAQEDLATVTDWLVSHGFTIDQVYPNNLVIGFSGTAAEVEGAFHTQIHYLDVNGAQHFANTSDPEIPAAFAPAVVGVVSLHNFSPHAMYVPAEYTTGGSTYTVVPADLQTIYNATPLFRLGLRGAGQTIAVVDDSDTSGTDVASYRSKFLSAYAGTVTTMHPGGCTDPGTNSNDIEADLDAEMVSAMAPDASVVVATCTTSSTSGAEIAAQNLINGANPPGIISISYGDCEVHNGAANNISLASLFQTAAGEGVSVFVSAGDTGASGCNRDFTGPPAYAVSGIGVNGWGVSQYDVVVGGTDFEDKYIASKGSPANPLSTYWTTSNTALYASAKSYIPEIPWNSSCGSWLLSNYAGVTNTFGTTGYCNTTGSVNANAGGGGPSGCYDTAFAQTDQTTYAVADGLCTGYPKPSFQAGIAGNPADGVRDSPDVSLFASSGGWGHYVTIYANGGLTGVGGTSASAPMMAGIQALVNQKWAPAWKGTSPTSGNPNPIYYQIANAEFGASGNSACYSINQPPPRGLGSSCVFYDITQGDIDIPCRYNSSAHVGCYLPSGTNGVLSTQALSSGSVPNGGSAYTSTPTCTLGAPGNLNSYLTPSGSTIWGGGTQATCTASRSGTTVNGVTISGTGQGYAGGTACTITGGGGSGAVCSASPALGTGAGSYQPAYGATPGWDFATGLGSVNAYNLVFNSAW